MQQSGEVITFRTVAEKAGVSREYLYQNFRSVIDRLRSATQSQVVQVDDEQVRVRTARRSATIEVALRNKIKRMDEELIELRKQKTALERRYEKALGEAEEWRDRHKLAVSEVLELRGRLARFER
jgi:hypothetical protein